MCNRHLSIDNQIDHRSYERQGKLKIPTIHEGADARKIEGKYLTGQIWNGSWKVEENQMIKKQNALLQKVITTFGKVSGALSIWRECLNDIRRKQEEKLREPAAQTRYRKTRQKETGLSWLKNAGLDTLTLNERLNSENRAGNIQALKNDLRKTKELLQSEKEKRTLPKS